MQVLNKISFSNLVKALEFAADKHKFHKRKGKCPPPYINHPIEVMQTLWEIGGVEDIDVLIAALLHDTIEDTKTSSYEVGKRFGEKVLSIVMEVTIDKYLGKDTVKQLQIDMAPHLSKQAKQLKLSDLICNLTDISGRCVPEHWDMERRKKYFEWAKKVAIRLEGCNAALEQRFWEIHSEGMKQF